MNVRTVGVVISVALMALVAYWFFGRAVPENEERPVEASKEAVAPQPEAPPAPALKPPPPPPPAPVPAKVAAAEPQKEFPRRAGPRERAEKDPAKLPPPPPPPKTARQRFVRARTEAPQVILRGEAVPEERLDEIMVWGTDKESLRGSIQEQYEEFARCYEAWLAVEPELDGRLKVGFTIGLADERDSLASVVGLDVVDSELDHAVFEGCILGALQDLTYDPPDGNLTVHYPLMFRPSGDSDD